MAHFDYVFVDRDIDLNTIILCQIIFILKFEIYHGQN